MFVMWQVAGREGDWCLTDLFASFLYDSCLATLRGGEAKLRSALRFASQVRAFHMSVLSLFFLIVIFTIPYALFIIRPAMLLATLTLSESNSSGDFVLLSGLHAYWGLSLWSIDRILITRPSSQLWRWGGASLQPALPLLSAGAFVSPDTHMIWMFVLVLKFVRSLNHSVGKAFLPFPWHCMMSCWGNDPACLQGLSSPWWLFTDDLESLVLFHSWLHYFSLQLYCGFL